MATPNVPARPARTSAVKDNMPQVPPRPIRKLDPSPSQGTRAPLNDFSNALGIGGKRRSQNNPATPDPPQRPPIVTLPSVGQEGLEYASFDQLPAKAHGVSIADAETPEQTRNVSANVPLHAPTASVPLSTAKSRIATVTHTDSTQAAAAGIGKSKPDDDVHKSPADLSTSLSRVTSKAEDMRRVSSAEPHPLRQEASFNRSTPSLLQGTSRPGSVLEGNHEQGIPEIGMQIPLYPNAGDVQAPSPAPTQSQYAPGIGYFNDGSTRAHTRKRSSRQEFGPPGSYGMHSHGQEPQDQFEKDWAAKNPDKAALEGTAWGTPRPETALSSADLNRLVTQNSDIGMGTDPNMIGTPGEEVAWGATEEYLSRVSPKPSPGPVTERKKRPSSGTQPAVESPLRKASIPYNERTQPDDALEGEDGDTIHVDPPERKVNKYTGGGEVDGALDLGPQGGNTEERGGWFDERGEGTPILASDEILKRPGSAYMQPAVEPEAERNGDDNYESDHGPFDNSRRSSLRVPSRPSSRPNSMHGEFYYGGNLHRFMSHEEHHGSGMHTPLEEIEEYEPLIPEGEEEPKPKPKAVKKRPGLEHHHFPSQDIWEDTPLSLQYHTTVDTPEPPREAKAMAPPPSKPSVFETPEQEQQRRRQNPNDMYSDNKTLINKPQVRAIQEESRPGMQRFPSQDIWEDTPDSMRLVTTVSSPQMDETKSPPDDRPTTTAMSEDQDDEGTRATTGFTQMMKPSIPARPHRKSKLAEEIKPDVPGEPQTEESQSRDISDSSAEKQTSPNKAKAPELPARPKPTIPMRPARTQRAEQSDGAELTKSISAEGPAKTATSPPIPKAKPAVPARPVGEKIAALKSGFMNDLNKRLQLGPQAPPPKVTEPEPEVAEASREVPLADARKSRTKGPARRKPAASPSAAAEEKLVAFSMSTPLTVWQIDESDELQVPSITITPADEQPDLSELEKVMTENTARNTADAALTEPMSPEKAEAIALQPEEAVDAERSEPEQPATAASVEAQKAIESTFDTTAEVPSGALTSADVSRKGSIPAAEVPSDAPTSVDVEEKELAPATASEGDADQPSSVGEPLLSEGEATAKEGESLAQ